MSRGASDPIPLKGLLGSAASDYGLDDALAAGSLLRRWAEVVGETLAEHAFPSSLRGGTLRVRAESPVWAHEIGYLAAEIKGKANAFLGREAVTEVKVWTSPEAPATGPTQTAARRVDRPGRAPTPDVEEDPQIALERARAAWLERTRGGPRKGPSERPS